MRKYIFVTGGVVSGLGKGLTAASIGRLLKNKGLKIFMQKFDPYLNSSPSLMDPLQHGEVFVTADGGETDLDLGHYERLIDEELSSSSSLSSGKVYKRIFEKEARGEFGGSTIQIVPHVTNEIIKHLSTSGEETNADVVITEIGGTVGDIESQPFLEAIRQFAYSKKPEDVLFVHITLVPTIPISDELKTKPTQHSYRELMSFGIKPDLIILRSSCMVPEEMKEKIGRFCSLPKEAIIQSKNVDILYELPIVFKNEGLDKYIENKLKLKLEPAEEEKKWEEMVNFFKTAEKEKQIALIGEDVSLPDIYLSITRAIYDAGLEQGYKVKVKLVSLNDLKKKKMEDVLKNCDGVMIAGEIKSTNYDHLATVEKLYDYLKAKEIPYLGIGSGFDFTYALLTENRPLENIKSEVGARIIGNQKIKLKKDSTISKIYGKLEKNERCRIPDNTMYKQNIAKNEKGFEATGTVEENIAVIENNNYKFFVAVAYHPEFRSRPNRISKLIREYLKNVIAK